MKARAFVAAAGVVAGAIAVRVFFGDQLEPKALLEQFRAAAASGWGVPVYLLAYTVGTTLLVPAVAFHIVAGALWGFWEGVGWSLIAVNLVSNGHFFFGRAMGRERVQAFLQRRGWAFVQNELSEHGVMAMLAVRQLPLPFLAVNVAAGASGLKWRDFFIGSGLGVLPPLLVYTSFSTALLEGVEGAKSGALVRALLGGVGMLALVVVTRLVRRKRQTRPT